MKTKPELNYSNVNQAIKKGVNYLLNNSLSGRWNGFPTLAGESDIWVTGFVMAHIQALCKNQDTLKDTKEFLIASRQPTHGWSYSAIVPSDADSTAWCITALEQVAGVASNELEKSKSFLWSHFVEHGISTYNVNSGIGNFISAHYDEAIAGWCAPHPDVSIAAVLADVHHEKVPGILAWFQSLSTDEGFINSYWWRGPFYTTTLMLRALHIRGEALPKEQAERLLKGLKNLQLDDGGFALETGNKADPFSTALALEAFSYLSDIGGQNETHACAKALLKMQTEHGSWAGDFILRIPAPNVLNPETVMAYDNVDLGGNSFVQDKEGLFATVMACYALNRFRHTYSTNNTPL